MDNTSELIKHLTDNYLGNRVIFDNGHKPTGSFIVQQITPRFREDKTLIDIYFMSSVMNSGFSYKDCYLEK